MFEELRSLAHGPVSEMALLACCAMHMPEAQAGGRRVTTPGVPWVKAKPRPGNAEGGISMLSWQNNVSVRWWVFQPEVMPGFAETCHSKLPREAVCPAVTGCAKPAMDGAVSWRVLSPENTSHFSAGMLAFRCQKAQQQPKKQPISATCKAGSWSQQCLCCLIKGWKAIP